MRADPLAETAPTMPAADRAHYRWEGRNTGARVLKLEAFLSGSFDTYCGALDTLRALSTAGERFPTAAHVERSNLFRRLIGAHPEHVSLQ